MTTFLHASANYVAAMYGFSYYRNVSDFGCEDIYFDFISVQTLSYSTVNSPRSMNISPLSQTLPLG